MAFSSSGRFFMSMTFEDQGNNLSKVEVQIDAADIDAAEVIAAASIVDFVAISKAYIISYSVREEFINGAARTPAGQVEEKAVITLALATAPKKAVLTVPAPVDAIFGASGTDLFNKVLTTQTLVTNLCGHFVSDLMLSDGEHIATTPASILKGNRAHRGSSRG